MTALLDDLDVLLGRYHGDVRATYDDVADRYDRFRALWLRLAGGEAEQAMLDDLDDTLSPGQSVLDAGAGTGALSREILSRQPGASITMLDLSPRMLARADDLPAVKTVGSMLEIPFEDNSFDIVVSAWVIETVADPIGAVSECLRVLSPDGHLYYSFCSLPDGWLSLAGSALLRAAVKRGFAGSFLAPEHTPWHDCDRSHIRRFRGGLTTEIALRKCCSVGPETLPDAQAGRRG